MNQNQPVQEQAGFQNYGSGEYPLKVFDPEYRIRKAVERMSLSGNSKGRHLAAAMRKLLRSACGCTCFSVSIYSLLNRITIISNRTNPGSLIPATLVAYRQEQKQLQCIVMKLYCKALPEGTQEGPLYEDAPGKVLLKLKGSGFTTGVICRGDFLKPIQQVLQARQEFQIL